MWSCTTTTPTTSADPRQAGALTTEVTAVGFRAHMGWANSVVLTVSRTGAKLRAREDVDLRPLTAPAHPYHAVAEMPADERADVLARSLAETESAAIGILSELLADHVGAVGVVISPGVRHNSYREGAELESAAAYGRGHRVPAGPETSRRRPAPALCHSHLRPSRGPRAMAGRGRPGQSGRTSLAPGPEVRRRCRLGGRFLWRFGAMIGQDNGSAVPSDR
jgi:hypothetical protein